MGGVGWWGGGLCDFSVSPSPNWTFGFWTDLVLGLGLGLGGLDFRLGLDNNNNNNNNNRRLYCLSDRGLYKRPLFTGKKSFVQDVMFLFFFYIE